MTSSWLVFPHQLFRSFLNLPKNSKICIIEEPLFFKDECRSTSFAKIKLAYTRATMKCFEDRLFNEGFIDVKYFNFKDVQANNLESLLVSVDKSFKYYETVDNLLEEKLSRFDEVKLERVDEWPNFLYSKLELEEYLKQSKSNPFFQTSFYRYFRELKGILMTKTGGYLGGKLSFDSENRKKLPKGMKLKDAFENCQSMDKYWSEAKEYVETNFPDNPGDLSAITALLSGKLSGLFPISFEQSEIHLDRFLNERLCEFGPYQDAFVTMSGKPIDYQLQSGTLYHSAISPMLNCGLLTVDQIIDKVNTVVSKAPVQSIEGFIRQIIGWREFIRFVYIYKGEEMRKANQLNNLKQLDNRWYEGKIGIPPVDDAIKYAFRFGYLHHILRLMVVANFMNLSKIHPNEIYKWFLDFSLDAYDWVMIGNVYGMATFASPIMSTKPYISGSNYILKMSDYQKADWCQVWDGLFYNFLNSNSESFHKNGRMNMMMANLKRKDPIALEKLLSDASKFLKTLPNINKHKTAE